MVQQVPKTANLLLDITLGMTNVSDFGNYSLWSLDSGMESWITWLGPDGTGYVLQSFVGEWQTFKGATSPGAGAVEPADGSGPLVTVTFFTAHFAFTPGSMQTRGYIGSFDGGGTKANILLGSYALQNIIFPIGQIYSIPIAPYFANDAGFYYISYHSAQDYFYSPTQLGLCAAYTNTQFMQLGDIVT